MRREAARSSSRPHDFAELPHASMANAAAFVNEVDATVRARETGLFTFSAVCGRATRRGRHWVPTNSQRRWTMDDDDDDIFCAKCRAPLDLERQKRGSTFCEACEEVI